MNNEHLYQLKTQFLEKWPISKLKTMTIEEYTNLEKTSFCYWLEAITTDLGSIWGGSAYKFGIFKRQDLTESSFSNTSRKTDGEYSWYSKYGSTKEEVFDRVKNIIIRIAQNALEDDLDSIEEMDLGDAYKWKLTFLYSEYKVINIFKYDSLKSSAEFLGYDGKDKRYPALNRFILSQLGKNEYYSFAHELWSHIDEPSIEKAVPMVKRNDLQLNQILFGPPGTGKTYSTIDKIVSICAPESYDANNHVANKVIYDELVKNGRVVFTTFHQSVAYEDFIEGIKPVKPGDEDTFLKYDIEPGIFKQIANNAKKIHSTAKNAVEWDKVDYYKMSIGGKQNPNLHDWCIDNNVVGLGWGGDEDLSLLLPVLRSENWKGFRDKFKIQFKETAEENRFHIQAAFIFMKMKVGDIVVISKGNHIIDAIGKITGEYYFDDQTPNPFTHYRKVEWIATNMDASPEKFIAKQISQQSMYEFSSGDVKKEAFNEITSQEKVDDKAYAIVIDEINRGNISSIFGELITVIEEDKRQGAKNELKLTLPYSKEKFSVPSNLYIIGTMNTADRSVEALDTALRRRFSFIEMMPDPKVLVDEKGEELSVKLTKGMHISLAVLLSVINERIEVLIDRDHMIGHAFFFNLNTMQELKNTFHKNIIPLLQEYFYGNYEKMELVIGSQFFKKEDRSKVKFAVPNSDFSFEGKSYTVIDASKMNDEHFTTALNELMNGKSAN